MTSMQQLYYVFNSMSEHHRTIRSKLSFFLKMDSSVYIHLIFLCIVNIIFTVSGIFLNILVIVSIWKSSQLRKKLCHFMIMVLSCFDLVAVVTNYPVLLLYLISWVAEDYDLLPKRKVYLHLGHVFLAFSALVLLVMNIERYLGAYYPIFHRTSVTRRRLLTLLAILVIPSITITIVCLNDLIISLPVATIIYMALFLPPFTFVNFKLLIIAIKVRRRRATSPEHNKAIRLKNISSGLFAVACIALLSIPCVFNIVFILSGKSTNTKELAFIWVTTCVGMNCTFNSLIFFWKNKVLRAEGIKILKTLKGHFVGS